MLFRRHYISVSVNMTIGSDNALFGLLLNLELFVYNSYITTYRNNLKLSKNFNYIIKMDIIFPSS